MGHTPASRTGFFWGVWFGFVPLFCLVFIYLFFFWIWFCFERDVAGGRGWMQWYREMGEMGIPDGKSQRINTSQIMNKPNKHQQWSEVLWKPRVSNLKDRQVTETVQIDWVYLNQVYDLTHSGYQGVSDKPTPSHEAVAEHLHWWFLSSNRADGFKRSILVWGWGASEALTDPELCNLESGKTDSRIHSLFRHTNNF